MKTIDKIVLTVLILIGAGGHFVFPVGKMLGYDMPFFSSMIGILGLLSAITLGIVYTIWRKL